MQHPPQRSWRPFALGLGSFLLIVIAFLAVGHFAHAAITIENVGGSLGLGAADLKQTIVNVIKWALGLLGLVAVIVMLYGGFLWLTSRGNQQQIDKAKKTLLNGAIGLVIILVAWAIVLFIQRFITSATNGATASGQCQMSLPAEWGYCNLCDDAADPRPDYGILYPDPTCITPETRDYYATWEDPADTATNIKLCQAVSAGFGGLIQTAPNPPFENDILDPGSDFSVYRCTGPDLDPGPGVNPSCATSVEVNGTPNFTNNVASLNPAEDYMPNSKYYVDVSQIRSVASGNPAASRPIPPDGWTFLTGTENDEDPPGVLQICSQLRCSNDTTTRCTTDADCGAGNTCQPLRCQTDAQCGGTETCNPRTAPANGETIQCLSPIIEVQFTEGMYPPSAMNPANMAITRTDGQPTSVGIARIDMPRSDMIQVTLNQPLVKNVTYRITLSAENGADDTKGYRDTCSNALDCGNELGRCTQSGLPTQGTPADDYRFDFTTADTDTVDCTPIVTGISSPSFHGNQADQNLVTITGSNFGLSGGKAVRFSGNILATQNGGSVSQCFANSNLANQATSPACIQSVSNTQIRTIVPTGPLSYSPTGAIDGGVVVIKGTQESPLSTATTDIQSPHINGIYPREGKAGRFVTIQGDNFGASGRVRFRSNDGATSVWADVPSCDNNTWSNSQIIVQVPEGFAENAITNIQVCGKGDVTCANVANVSNTSRFDYKNIDGPNLCGLGVVGSGTYAAPFGSNNPTDPLEAEGDGFGTNLAQTDAGYSSLDGNVTSLIDDKHLIAAPNGALPNGSYNFFVTVNGQASNFITYTIPKDPPPQVVQDASCNASAGVMPSPNPYPGSTNVCRNSSFQARFNQAMVTADVTNFANVRLERCGTGPTFSCATPAPLLLLSITFAPPGTTPTYTPRDSFVRDTWYRVTLVGANLHSDSTGVAMGADYVWTFHVRPDDADCAYSAVAVTPPQAGPLYTAQTQPYVATPTNAQCALLTGIPGSFTWNSSDISLATVAANVPPNPSNAQATATVSSGSANGTAHIRATLGTVSGEGLLSVQRNYCDTDADCSSRQNDEATYLCTGSTCNVATHTCRPWIQEIQFPSGPAGNMLNVNGCFFGSQKGDGEVTFSNPGPPPVIENGSFAICGPAGWTNDTIRVQAMPESAASGSVWNVQVRTDTSRGGFTSNTSTYTITNTCRAQDGTIVPVPATGVPILCSISPPARREGESVAYAGSRFVVPAPSSQAFFTAAGDTFDRQILPGTGTSVSSATSAVSHVPSTTGIPTVRPTAQTTIGTPSGGQYCIATPVDFAVSCNLNSECSTGCCQANICRTTATCTNGFVTGVTNPTGTCRNTQFSITIADGKTIVPSTVNATTIQLLNGTTPVSASLLLVGQTITVRPSVPLVNGVYTIFLRGGAAGIQATDGTFLLTEGFTSASYTVDDTFRICTIARVSILSAVTNLPITSDLFTCSGDTCADDALATAAGNQHPYLVRAYDATGAGPLTLSSYAWTQADAGGSYGPTNTFTPSTAGAPCPTNETSEGYCATGQNVASGSEQLTVAVVGTGTSGTGTTSIPIRTFMCTKPWPAAPNPWPFRDPVGIAPANTPSHDFTFGYCTDDVQGAELSLPVVQSPASGEVRKEYFMFVEDKDGNRTGDSIGVRILGSSALPFGAYAQDLSPKRWYERTFGKPSTGTTFEVDGYPALREGRTVYVTADYVLPDGRSYPAVYVFSYNDNANSATKQIFEQIIKNIHFNDGQTPTVLTQLRQDVKRFHAMLEVVYGIAAYYRANEKNPALDTGTYLKNLTMTAWPSWQQTLGTALRITMPADPQGLWDPAATPRQLPAICAAADGFNQTTCWDEVDKVMQFPSNTANPPESTAIAYVYHPADGSVSLLSTFSPRVARHFVAWYLTHDPSSNICPAPSSCNGFNVEIRSTNFGAIDEARTKPPADTTNPTVAIEAPAAGNIAGYVTFVVVAADTAGGSGMSSVRFSMGGSTSTVSVPGSDGKYRWTWNSRLVVNNPYTLTVTAADQSGNEATATRSYTVANAPGDTESPVLNAPAPPDQSASASGIQWNGTDVTLTASATDVHPAPSPATNNTGVAKIEFYLGTSKLAEAANPACATTCTNPFAANVTVPAATISGFPNGTYTYSAVAYDGYGNTSVRTYTVIVAKTSGDTVAPTVAIVLPAPTTTEVSGANTDVVAEASDANGIDRVEFFIDTEGVPRAVDFNGPFSFSWIFDGYVDGSTHTVTANAYDRFGNRASATRSVTYHGVVGPDTIRPSVSGETVTLDTGDTESMEGAQLRNTVTLNATLTDNQAIRAGELRIDGVRIPLSFGAYTCATPQVCTIAYAWNTLIENIGPHTVSITAYDTAGYATTVSHAVSVVNQVTMSISTPSSGSTVQDSTATGTCALTTSRTCTTSSDCPLTAIGTCEMSPSSRCLSDVDCSRIRPGDICNAPHEACNATGSTGVPVTISVSKTCRADLLLSSVDIFLDGAPLTSIRDCNGTCSYVWSTKTTTSNGSHVLSVIGQDSLNCHGGDKSTVIVNNVVNDTVPPIIDSLSFNGTPWPGTGTVYVTGPGIISVQAHDPAGGSGMRSVTIAVQNSSGAQVALQTCNTADALAPNPCELAWAPADGEGYAVIVNAQDVTGNAAPAQTQVVNVDQTPPTAAWSAPSDGTTVMSPLTIAMQGRGVDPQLTGYASGIARLEYWSAGTLIATGSAEDPAGSGIFPAILSAVGTYQMSVRAFDRAGNQSLADSALKPLTITAADTTPPTVAITYPSVNNYYYGGMLNLTAAAADNAGGVGVLNVEFFRGGVSMGTPDALPPYTYAWDTTTVPNGSYSITARACDRLNNCAISTPRTVLVNNANGTNCGPLICSGATPWCCGAPSAYSCSASACIIL